MICIYSNWLHGKLTENILYRESPLPIMKVSMFPISVPGIHPQIVYELTWFDSDNNIAYYKMANRWRG